MSYRYTGSLMARACQCSFCRRHGARTASDPQGYIRFLVREDTLQRYQFAGKSTDFMLCSRCGCYLGAMIDNERACVNLTACLMPIEARPMDYETESLGEKRSRRMERWSPADVLTIREVPARGNGLLGLMYEELSKTLGEFSPEDGLEEQLTPFLVLFEGDKQVACGGLKLFAPGVGEIKRMFTHPEARGRGMASDLLCELELAARRLGMTELLLDTAGPLAPAQALYLSNGFREIDRYNDNPYAAKWFAKKLEALRETARE